MKAVALGLLWMRDGIALVDGVDDFIASGGVDEGDAAAAEASSAKARAVDAGLLRQNFVERDQLWAAALVLIDRARARLIYQHAKFSQIARSPRLNTRRHALHFAKVVRGPTARFGGQRVAPGRKRFRRNVSQTRIIGRVAELSRRRLALGHAAVVARANQPLGAAESRIDNQNIKRSRILYRRNLGDFARLTVDVSQVISRPKRIVVWSRMPLRRPM